VGIGGIVFVLHRGRDFVVRLRKHAFERRESGIVTEGAKGLNPSHEISPMEF
jgi:hypothetical protein